MTRQYDHIMWQVFGASMVGRTNQMAGIPRQDAMHWWPVSGRGRRVAMAIADGAGTLVPERSARGAAYAAHTATQVMREFITSNATETDPKLMRKYVKEDLPRWLIDRWQEAIDGDLRYHPYTDEERAKARLEARTAKPAQLPKYMPYATSLLVLGVTDFYLIVLNIGDGNIGTVTSLGDSELLMHNDGEKLVGVLSLRDPMPYVKSAIVPLGKYPPALISGNTDGFRQAFDSAGEFMMEGTDMLQQIRKLGLLQISQNLQVWLRNRAGNGSGDDMSLGLISLLNDYQSHSHLRKQFS